MLGLIMGAFLPLWRDVSGNPVDPHEGEGSPQAADPLLGQPSRTEQGQPAASPPGEDLKEESALNGSHQSGGRNVQK